jgi:hypothetical protein
MMKMQKSLLAAVTCALGAITIAWVCHVETHADDAKKQAPPAKSLAMQTFMRVKLGQAQGILEGLTVEDFDLIERNASAMFLLTKAEQWKSSKDPRFVQHSDEFARVAEQLAKYAKEKNLDGASLAYMQLTLNCIECHRLVRDRAIQIRGLSDEKKGEN